MIVYSWPVLREAPAVEIVEVAPRDGLQNESTPVGTASKVALIRRALEAGVRRVEVTSFVNPARVPQMADAEAVCAALPRVDGVRYAGLVANRRGVERAASAGVHEINAVVVVTDTFCERNQGMPTARAIDEWRAIADDARAAKLTPTVTLAAAFGCPFEGEVALARLVEVAARVAEAGPVEIVLADTIGVAVPPDITARVSAVREVAQGARLRCHLHNTRNTGLANAVAAIDAGVSALDASLGGVGGCPFAPRATGNIPTEDLVYLLERMGVRTGISLEALLGSVEWLEGELGKPTPGLLAKAGAFPQVVSRA